MSGIIRIKNYDRETGATEETDEDACEFEGIDFEEEHYLIRYETTLDAADRLAEEFRGIFGFGLPYGKLSETYQTVKQELKEIERIGGRELSEEERKRLRESFLPAEVYKLLNYDKRQCIAIAEEVRDIDLIERITDALTYRSLLLRQEDVLETYKARREATAQEFKERFDLEERVEH